MTLLSRDNRFAALALNTTVFAVFLGGWWSYLYGSLLQQGTVDLRPDTQSLLKGIFDLAVAQTTILLVLALGVLVIAYQVFTWILLGLTLGAIDPRRDQLLVSVLLYVVLAVATWGLIRNLEMQLFIGFVVIGCLGVHHGDCGGDHLATGRR